MISHVIQQQTWSYKEHPREAGEMSGKHMGNPGWEIPDGKSQEFMGNEGNSLEFLGNPEISRDFFLVIDISVLESYLILIYLSVCAFCVKLRQSTKKSLERKRLSSFPSTPSTDKHWDFETSGEETKTEGRIYHGTCGLNARVVQAFCSDQG